MKKIVKNNMKTIVVAIATSIICISGTAFATLQYKASEISYKDGKNVEQALNDLYTKNHNKYSSLKKIWSSYSETINYTYNAEKAGKYLIGIMNCNKENNSGTITTNGKEILNKTAEGGWQLYPTIKIVELKVGDTINLNGYNFSGTKANAFIVYMNNIEINEVVDCKTISDGTATTTYTASKEGESIIAISFANGNSNYSTGSIGYEGDNMSFKYSDNCDFIDYAILDKDSKVTVNSFGRDWGGGSVFILK